MKAWQIARDIVADAKARIVIEKDNDWTMEGSQAHEVNKIRTIWKSVAPGSGAPSSLIAGAVQSVENMGRNVDEAERLLEKGYKAYDEENIIELTKITSKIFYELSNAAKDINSKYWDYKIYNSWIEFKDSADFSQVIKEVDIQSDKFMKKVFNGWMGQICAGSFGTALEGYDRKTIKDTFGEVREYLKKPSTYNDDITYELAFLKTLLEKGKEISSKDIAENWVAMVPFGWSAEDIALKNLMMGIYPPESGYLNNPYREWIGAQMRGAICGMVAPGNPCLAANLAWIDGEISHHNSGIIGEVFNAVMTSLAFVEEDIKTILEKAINMLPKDSEYYYVVDYALSKCKESKDFESALISCEKEFEKYNLVHAFPNAAIEVVALWFGNGDFDETMFITAMAGLDVDCNAAQVGNIVGILNSEKGLDKKWTLPIGDDINTYVRGLEETSISQLTEWTVKCTEILNG